MEMSFSERVAEAKAAVVSVSPREANERKINDPELLFIDPRSASDIASTGIIPGALNVPLNELSDKQDSELPRQLVSHSRPIITACGAGPMGALAAYALKKRGFDNVAFVEGGTKAWVEAGFPTAR